MEEQTQKINRNVEHPSHYNQYPIETIDMMERIFGLEATELWCVMTAFKYRMRLGHKDDTQQDMEKEQWYLHRADYIRDKQKQQAAEQFTAEAKLRAINLAMQNLCDVQGLLREIRHILGE